MSPEGSCPVPLSKTRSPLRPAAGGPPGDYKAPRMSIACLPDLTHLTIPSHAHAILGPCGCQGPGPQASARLSSPPQAVEEGLGSSVGAWGSPMRWGPLEEGNRAGAQDGSTLREMRQRKWGCWCIGLPEAHLPRAMQANLGVQAQLHPKPRQQLE